VTVPLAARSGRIRVAARYGRRSNAVGPIRIRKPLKPLQTAQTALDGTGMWIWYVSRSSGGTAAGIIAQAQRFGVRIVFIKSSDGTTWWSQFNPQLVAALKAGGLRVCAWQFVYGAHPVDEAGLGVQAAQAGADCLVIDAESAYEGKYAQAQSYMAALRGKIGPDYSVALTGFPYVDYHPSFPYSVFLGPGGAQNNTPQMYWPDIQVSPDTVFSHTYQYNLVYGRPLEPLGETSGNPPPGQIVRFRQLSRLYGAPNVSWWDWQETSGRDWGALAQPIGNLSASSKPNPQMPALSVKSRHGISSGDLVVWAQEHLVKAGARITIDGGFGPRTQSAVQSFQTSRGLSPSGVIDAATWQALLRYPPVNVTWSAKGARASAATARGSLVLAPPASSKLRTRHYEIPPHLGAGRGPA
jgi:hypothetical protein